MEAHGKNQAARPAIGVIPELGPLVEMIMISEEDDFVEATLRFWRELTGQDLVARDAQEIASKAAVVYLILAKAQMGSEQGTMKND
jgi:hypothetical protein